MMPPGAEISPWISAQALHCCGEGKAFLQNPHLRREKQANHSPIVARGYQNDQRLIVGPAGAFYLFLDAHSALQSIEPAGEQAPLVPPHNVPALPAGRIR